MVFHEFGHLPSRVGETACASTSLRRRHGPEAVRVLDVVRAAARSTDSRALLPIGGYCAMEGEDNKTSEAEQQQGGSQDAFPSSTASRLTMFVRSGRVW